MKCRRVEKLIPLYVEGDLASGKANHLASHLEWCGRCNWLADEYRESQSWLRVSATPEFDQSLLENFKAGVLRRIENDDSKPSLLGAVIQQWTRRQIFALSAAMLMIVGVVVFYIYQTRVNTQPSTKEARQTPEIENVPQPALPQVHGTETTPGAGSMERHFASSRASRKLRTASTVIATRTVELPTQLQPAPIPEDLITGSIETEQPPMLRIEIQTSDPNIRIIWFAPKEVESPKTNQ